LAPPLAFAMTQSGWYCEERGNRGDTSRSLTAMGIALWWTDRAARRTAPTRIAHRCGVGEHPHPFLLGVAAIAEGFPARDLPACHIPPGCAPRCSGTVPDWRDPAAR